jgi:hypothetical protein
MALLLIRVARPNHRHVTKFLGLTNTIKNNVAQRRINMRNLRVSEAIYGVRCVNGSVFPNLCTELFLNSTLEDDSTNILRNIGNTNPAT